MIRMAAPHRVSLVLSLLPVVAGLFVSPALHAQAAAPPPAPVQMWAAEQVKSHFEVSEKLDPKKTHLFDKLQKRFGRKAEYSSDEVLAIEVPEVPVPGIGSVDDRVRTLPVPYDAFSNEEIDVHLAMLRISKPKTQATREALEAKYGKWPWYLATELRDIEANGAAQATVMMKREDVMPKPPTVVAGEAFAEAQRSKLDRALEHWQPIRIRKDWTDVMYDEDGSQDGILGKREGDLVGASFSFSTNNVTNSDTWSTMGALIFPWSYSGPVQSDTVRQRLTPDRYGVTPSVSLFRVTTDASGPRNSEVDQLLYRVGGYAEWARLVPGLTGLQLRAAGVFGTDTAHEARLGGFEFDLEPRFLMGQKGGKETLYKIGYRNTLWHKEPLLENGADQSLLDYQLRLWVHGEGGDIQNVSRSWGAVPESFFRIGPSAQLRVNMPRLWKGFAITAQYSHLPTIYGATGHESLFKLDATLTLLSDTELRRKISLNAGYTSGGLAYTRQDVDVFTLGLSVLF